MKQSNSPAPIKRARRGRRKVTPTLLLGQKDTLAKATWLYHHQKLTQQQVADELGLSRPTVVRLLRQALEEGIVTVSLRVDVLRQMELATRLAKRFGLQEVFIVPTSVGHTEADVLRAVGEMGALYLENNLQPNQVITLSWGKTLLEVARALNENPVKGLVIAQTLGGLNSGHTFNPYRVASLFGEKLHAPVYHLYVPVIVASKEVRDLFMSDPGVQATLAVARLAAQCMVSVGKVDHSATVVQTGFLNTSTIDQLRARGAVGDISGRYFDIDGKRILGDVDDRILALPWEDFQRLKNVVAVACGLDKKHAILGALRTGVLSRLIIDDQTALALLEEGGGDFAPEPAGSREGPA
ncbi:MAG: sugar-binding transcriptional regulator [Verrucomicrobia bacterium]|nr:sugar-binding transcriptional regulator [Verrucomicrobiota bacterium]